MVNQNYPQKPTKANHIDVEFSGHRLTNYGGLSVFSEFLFDKLDFSQHVEQHLHLGMGSNCSYKNEQVLGLVVFGFLCGHERLAHFENLGEDVLAQQLLGLSNTIDEDTIGRRDKQATPKSLSDLVL